MNKIVFILFGWIILHKRSTQIFQYINTIYITLKILLYKIWDYAFVLLKSLLTIIFFFLNTTIYKILVLKYL